MNDITIRNVQFHEMNVMSELAFREGWNPGINDGEFLFHADKSGFFVALLDNQVVGSISSVNYENNLGFIGLHIVVPHLRNQGLGKKLLNHAIEKTGDINVGINCRDEQIEYYKGFGFKPAFNILSYEGISNGEYKMPPNIISPMMQPFDDLYGYYRKTFPYERKVFISYWVNQPKSLLLGKYENDEYKGFGLFKPCRKGYRLAPLISDDPQSANEILTALVSHFEAGTPYYMDMPEPNKEGLELAEKLKLKKIGETIRMYTGKEHEISLNNTYSFTNLEVG